MHTPGCPVILVSDARSSAVGSGVPMCGFWTVPRQALASLTKVTGFFMFFRKFISSRSLCPFNRIAARQPCGFFIVFDRQDSGHAEVARLLLTPIPFNL